MNPIFFSFRGLLALARRCCRGRWCSSMLDDRSIAVASGHGAEWKSGPTREAGGTPVPFAHHYALMLRSRVRCAMFDLSRFGGAPKNSSHNGTKQHELLLLLRCCCLLECKKKKSQKINHGFHLREEKGKFGAAFRWGALFAWARSVLQYGPPCHPVSEAKEAAHRFV